MPGGETGNSKRTTPAPRRALRRDEREREILNAAITVLDRDRNAGLDEISAEAGVTRQLVSLYFPGGGIQAIVDRIVGDAIPILIDAIEAMEDTDLILEIEDEEAFRAAMSVGMDAYLKHVLERAPIFMLGHTRDLAGATVEKQIEELHDAGFTKVFAGNARWGQNKLAKEMFRTECHTIESIGYSFRLGHLSREQCLAALVESLVAFRFSVLPALG